MCVYLGCGRKPEVPEGTHADTGRNSTHKGPWSPPNIDFMKVQSLIEATTGNTRTRLLRVITNTSEFIENKYCLVVIFRSAHLYYRDHLRALILKPNAFRSGSSLFPRLTFLRERRGRSWTLLIPFLAPHSSSQSVRRFRWKNPGVTGVYFIIRTHHRPTCFDTSPVLRTSRPAADGRSLGRFDTSWTRTGDSPEEDVAEGVQDMHAPHRGGGEFPPSCLPCLNLKPLPSWIVRTSVKRLDVTRLHMWCSMWWAAAQVNCGGCTLSWMLTASEHTKGYPTKPLNIEQTGIMSAIGHVIILLAGKSVVSLHLLPFCSSHARTQM